MEKARVFLSAEWSYLIMANYEVPAYLLEPYLPLHTEMDAWQGKTLVSLVGFMFQDTRVLNIQWPLHIHFEEVNLRFYVRRSDGAEVHRGVTFISEIVPKPIIAFMANKLYNEPYRAAKMKHHINIRENDVEVNYSWKFRGKWNSLEARAKNILQDIMPSSEEEFIFEHYRGYNKLNDHATVEYSIEHPRWQVYPVEHFSVDVDITGLYGAAFTPFLTPPPSSVFLAKGSPVIVRRPNKILTDLYFSNK